MKNILILLAALIAAFTLTVHAGPTEVSGRGQTLALPNVLFPGASNLVSPSFIDLSQQKDTAFQVTSVPLSGGVGCTNQYICAPSVDGVSYDTNSADVFTFSNSVIGGGPVTQTVKLNNSAYNYYKIVSTVTTGTSSNNVGYYSLKVGFP